MTNNALRNREIAANIRNKNHELAVKREEGEKDRQNAVTTSTIRGVSSAIGSIVGKAMPPLLSMSDPNSPAWYKRWPNLDNLLGGIPTYFLNGLLYDYRVGITPIVVYYYMDTYGPTRTRDDLTMSAENLPINEAALRYQTDLYSYNSVLATVAPSDVMQYTLAAHDLIKVIKLIKRGLHAFKTFNPNCQEFNRKLLEAMGFNVNDFIQHYKDYIAWLEQEIPSLNIDIAIPADMSILDRKNFLLSNVWAENDGKNAACYLFHPLCYHVWNESTGTLVPYQFMPNLTYSSLTSAYRTMKAALTGSSNIVELIRNIKSGVRNGLKLYIEEEFVEGPLGISPVDEVFDQIRNAVIVPSIKFVSGPSGAVETVSANNGNSYPTLRGGTLTGCNDAWLKQDASGFLIPCNSNTGTQAEDYIPQELSITSSQYHATNIDKIEPSYVNFIHDDVSSDDILVATRLRYQYHVLSWGDNTNAHVQIKIPYCGTEVILGMSMFFTTGNGAQSALQSVMTYGTNIQTNQFDAAIRATHGLTCIPEFIQLNFASNSLVTNGYLHVEQVSEVHDWHSTFKLLGGNLRIYHEAAVKSELYIGDTATASARLTYKSSKAADFDSGRPSRRGKGKKK